MRIMGRSVKWGDIYGCLNAASIISQSGILHYNTNNNENNKIK